MPIFEYKCGECGSNFEMFLKSRDEEKDLECLNCRSKNVKKQQRLMMRPIIVLSLICMFSAAMLAAVNSVTKDRIILAKKKEKQRCYSRRLHMQAMAA